MQWPWSLVSTENHTIFPLMLQCNSYIDCKVFSGLPKFQWPRNLTMKRAITRLSWKNCTSFWKWNSSDSDSLAWLHIIIRLIKKRSGTNSTCLHKLVDLKCAHLPTSTYQNFMQDDSIFTMLKVGITWLLRVLLNIPNILGCHFVTLVINSN